MKMSSQIICVMLLFATVSPVAARRRVETPVVNNPVVGDLNADGLVDMDEAAALMRNPAMKRDLFHQELAEQKRFYMSLDKRIRLKLVRLSMAYGTVRWDFAVDMARKKGLSAVDAERIALALRN